MNAELRGRKRLERSHDFHIWKVLGGGGALRELKRLTYDSVMYFYFRYPLGFRDLRDGWLAGVRLIMAMLNTTTAALILDCDDQ